MEYIGYASAVGAGMSLGLIGGGGSILIVPILVYLFALSPVLSTAYSLFIVGTASLFGATRYAIAREIDYKVGAAFAGPSIAGVFLSRHFLVPMLPREILRFNGLLITKETFVMSAFAVVMLAASLAMIRRGRKASAIPAATSEPRLASLPVKGFAVGLLTGFVGAGGGFLIIPALVILAGLPMKRAIGTSLAVIAVNSFIGFFGDASSTGQLDWPFLLSVAGATSGGIFVGTYLSRLIPGKRLEPAFGWFVLVMGSYIVVRQVLDIAA